MELYPHQKEALGKLKNGSVLLGGVGSGKSLTSVAYYDKTCRGTPLYIITTAKKRDDGEWYKELMAYAIDPKTVVIDSWNNIKKYVTVEDAFFIFDEQRLVSYGTWTKTFLKIVKKNKWILLTATPGDTWSELMPLFLANGFYRNKSEFEDLHCEFNPYTKWREVKKWHNVGRLVKQKRDILVEMPMVKLAVQHHDYIFCNYDQEKYKWIMRNRQNPETGEPFMNAGGLCYALRKVVNSDDSRISEIEQIWLRRHRRIIIFYSFDYELEKLRQMCESWGINYAEWNGHKHQPIPNDGEGSWIYLVNYSGGAEGWNCTKCNCIIFYSQTYSYKVMVQAAGRIDRLDTQHKDLYYYHLLSRSQIDQAISLALKRKKKFNENKFVDCKQNTYFNKKL